ncbi:small GTPase superfamily [Baffinella frigidus]|nr:small GTPase superfamily [Cryptophyta sp. CCMP2293]
MGRQVVLLGESSVGKSSLVLRFVRGQFVENSLPTVGAAFMTQVHTASLLPSLPTAHRRASLTTQEKFAALAPLYYHGAHVALVVYDITEPGSYNKAKFWVSELQQHGVEGVKIVLVGNKGDLEERRSVDEAEAEAYAKDAGFVSVQVSAKAGTGVQELFVKVQPSHPSVGLCG